MLAQTYPNWDYTICNNCSTDRTLEIAREYAAKDPRIRIHNNDTFVHVNENHNIAFRSISPQSKYCKVVAADEWIFPECIEKMVRVAEQHPSVAIVGSYGLCETKVVFDGLPYPSTVVIGPRAVPEVHGRFHLGRAAFLRRPDFAALPIGHRAEPSRVLQRGQPPRRYGGVLRVPGASRFRLRPPGPDRDSGTGAEGLYDHLFGGV